MRRLLVILAAFGMIWTVRALRMDGAGLGPDPLTLAAIGFVVLAAFTVGELGAALKLPKITGYIVSGVVLGPQIADVLSRQVVGEMQTFNNLALGLIATTAGLELDLSAIRKVLRTLLVTVAAKLPLLILLVGGAFFAAESVFGFLGLEDPQQILALGLIFAVLGVGTSPAIALAIVNENRAKGRLSDLVLAIAVVKDLVVVVCLAIAIAIARVLVAPGAPLGADVLVHVAEELGASIAAGAVVGGLLIAYMRFVRGEMLLAVLATVLVTAELSKSLHLELLLVFIAAGFVVRNLSEYEHELLHALERIALPVFVVFFTTAGADVDLEGTWTLLPLALVLAAARGGAFFLSAWLGAKAGKEAAPVARNAWLAYLPQAGVTLGLVLLAAEKLPELADPIGKTGTAMVALHLLIGPILLGVALRRAGEIPDAAGAAAEDAPPDAHGPAEPKPDDDASPVAAPEADDDGPELTPPGAAELAAEVAAPELVAAIERVRATLEAERRAFLEDFAEPRAAQALTRARSVLEPPEGDESIALALHRRLPKDRPTLVADWVPAVSRLEQVLRAEVHRLPTMVQVELTDEMLRSDPADPLFVGLRKLSARVARGLGLPRGKRRWVPLRLVGRLATEARVAEAAVLLAGAWPRSYAAMLHQVSRVAAEEISPEEAIRLVEEDAVRFRAYVSRVLAEMAHGLLEELARTARRVGGPELPLSQLRFSRVEPVARSARQRVEREAEAWRRIADASFDTVRARTAVHAFSDMLGEVLTQRVQGPLETARGHLLPVLEQVLSRLRAAREALEGDDVDVERALGLARSAYPKADRTRLRRARARFRRAAQGHLLVSELARVIDSVPAELTVLAPGTTLGLDDRVDQVECVPLDFGRRAEAVFLERLAPRIDRVLGPVADIVAGSDLHIDEVVQVAIYGMEAARQAHAEPNAQQTEQFRASLERAVKEGELLAEAFTAALDEAEKAFGTEGAQAAEELGAIVGAEGGASGRVRIQVRATRRAIRARLVALGRRAGAALTSLARRLGREAPLARLPDPQLDPAGLRAAVESETSRARGVELPPLYSKLFSPLPLEDVRLAAAHRDVLEQVAKRVGQRSRGAARILVVGAHGSGRTSLLNAVELRHQRTRVVRLDAFYHLRLEGVVSALAAELSCRDSEGAVLEALQERPTVVLVDDLERHVTADDGGARELERLVDIVVSSRADTAWVVTTTPIAQGALSALAPFTEAFDQRLELPSLGGDALRTAIEARSKLGGVPVELPAVGPVERLRRGPDAAAEHFYDRLASASQGNLRAALMVYVRSLRSGEGQGLTAVAPEPLRLPRLQRLSAQGLALLGLMLRFGPHDVPELARALRLPEEKVRLHVLHLVDAGLLHYPDGSAQELLYVPSELQSAVSAELVRLGLVGKEGA